MLQAESAALEEEESNDSSDAANDSNKPETGKTDASVDGNGDGNGQVPPGQTEDENGNIVNGGGNMAPGLNRGNKLDKPENPNKPSKPENPGTEDKDDKQANKANKGTHIYTYDSLNRMVSSNIAKTITKYTYDTLGNLVLETVKNKSVDYQYNELNQLVKKTTTQNDTFTYSYDKRGNRIAETGKKVSQQFEYDATNRLVKGVNWKSDVSEYTYNGLGLRVNNLVTTHANKTYDRDYVIDYTSPENDDLYVYALGNGQLEYEQRHVYAGSERLEQITEKGNGGWERTLYVHEDVMGNTRYYTKATGQSFAELEYDAWGQPVSPNKLVNNDHGNYVFATFTGHIYDTTLDIYFAEARFYDATNRQWLAMDPVKDGLNWYRYADDNPTTYWDPYGTEDIVILELPFTTKRSPYETIYPEWGYVHKRVQQDILKNNSEMNLEMERTINPSGRVDIVQSPEKGPTIPYESLQFWEVKPLSYAYNPEKQQSMVVQMERYAKGTIETPERSYGLIPADQRVKSNTFDTKAPNNSTILTVSYFDAGDGKVYYSFHVKQQQEEPATAQEKAGNLQTNANTMLEKLFGTPMPGWSKEKSGPLVNNYFMQYASCFVGLMALARTVGVA